MAEKSFLVDINLNGNIIKALKEAVFNGQTAFPTGAEEVEGAVCFLTTDIYGTDGTTISYPAGLYYYDGTDWIRLATGSNTEELLERISNLEVSIQETNATLTNLSNSVGGAFDTMFDTTDVGVEAAASISDLILSKLGNLLDSLPNSWNDSIMFKTFAYNVGEVLFNGGNKEEYYPSENGGLKLSLDQDTNQITLKMICFDNEGGEVELSLGSISVGDIIISDILDDADVITEDGKTYIQFTFNTAGGSQSINVDVTDLVDVYTNGNGLTLEDNEFSVKANTSKGIIVDADGVGVNVDGETIEYSNNQLRVGELVWLSMPTRYTTPSSTNWTRDTDTKVRYYTATGEDLNFNGTNLKNHIISTGSYFDDGSSYSPEVEVQVIVTNSSVTWQYNDPDNDSSLIIYGYVVYTGSV